MSKPSVTKSGTRKLSDVARHLVLPSGIVSSGWRDIDRQCRALGITFEAWQDGIGRAAFAKRADGVYAASVGGVVMSIPRQVGKTYLVGGIAFALCLQNPGTKVIWTAHHSNTADETFESMSAMAQMAKIAPHIRAVRSTNGQQRVVFRNKSRIEFGARERGFGRGKQKVSFLVLDEAQILTESALENMVPSMNRANNPLMFMMGTPPRPVDPGEVFTNKRARSLSGAAGDTFFLEISASDDADPDDRKQWAIANPSYPHFTPDSAMLRMRELFTPDGFRREALGVWDADTVEGAFPVRNWSDAKAVLDAPLASPVVALDVRMGVQQSISLSVVGNSPQGVVAVVGRYEQGHGQKWSNGQIVGWVAAELEKRGVQRIVVDEYGENGPLIPLLEDAGLTVLRLKTGDMRNACMGFHGAVVNGQVHHADDEPLNTAVTGARRRKSGEGWLWSRTNSVTDIGPLMAVAGAWWVHASTDGDYDVMDSFF